MKKSIQTPLGVYTDDEVGIEMIESYANQRVIDELKKQNEPNRKTNWLRTMKASILLILKKILMRGIISKVLQASIKKGLTLNVVKRYLKMKYKIAVSVVVLTNRIKNLK